MKNLDSAVIYNLSSLPIISEYIEYDLNAFRNVFSKTKIITFDYDVWSKTSDTIFISTEDDKSIMKSILELEEILEDFSITNTANIVFGTTINEEYENLIADVIDNCNFYSNYKHIIDYARTSKYYDKKLEYSIENVICSHVTFYFYTRWHSNTLQKQTILRVLNDSVEIPMKWLLCKQAYIVDSHAQSKTKWVDKVHYYPVVHFSTKAFAFSDKEKKYNFSFGMSNYTGDSSTERSRIEYTMHNLAKNCDACNFYVSGNVYNVRTKIPYSEYLEKVAESYCTMIIPSYDENAFSVRRISESIHNKTILLFWSTKDFRKLFDSVEYQDMIDIYESYGLLLTDNPSSEEIRKVINNSIKCHEFILNDLKKTNFFKQWYDMSWYKEQMLTILTNTNA